MLNSLPGEYAAKHRSPDERSEIGAAKTLDTMDAVMTPDPDFAYAQSGYAMPVADRERRPSAGDLRDRLDDASTTSSTRFGSSPSPVMRITGSVPDGAHDDAARGR